MLLCIACMSSSYVIGSSRMCIFVSESLSKLDNVHICYYPIDISPLRVPLWCTSSIDFYIFFGTVLYFFKKKIFQLFFSFPAHYRICVSFSLCSLIDSSFILNLSNTVSDCPSLISSRVCILSINSFSSLYLSLLLFEKAILTPLNA